MGKNLFIFFVFKIIIIFIEKTRYLLIGLLYADDDNASRRNCDTIAMMNRNSLAGEMLKIKLVEIDILIEDKRVRHVESIATVLAFWFKNG